VLKRFFLMRARPATVHKTLCERGLVDKARRKAVKNLPKPRFFERSRPNQLWQSDIMTFRLAGHNAYLIDFIDDYSRYITSLSLYRSQTAEHVLETYRRGVAEYGVPREILTDNGRQYTNWRGKTRFEQQMKKDRVRHIRSRPHHPMTLGKLDDQTSYRGSGTSQYDLGVQRRKGDFMILVPRYRSLHRFSEEAVTILPTHAERELRALDNAWNSRYILCRRFAERWRPV
jgi:hypothetical protein